MDTNTPQTSTTGDKENMSQMGKKEARRREAIQRRRSERIRNFALLIVLGVAVGYGIHVFLQRTTPRGDDHSRAVPIMSDISHIPVGQSVHVEYNSNPPTSGPHYAQTAMSGFREESISDGHLIHNLEHGDIWISYHPSVSDEVKEQLQQFVHPKVVITPREENDTDIALAAWGRLDTFDIEDGVVPVQRIEDFIHRYMYQGPEHVPGASGGV